MSSENDDAPAALPEAMAETQELFCNLAQFINAAEQDWKIAGHWSAWDQAVVEGFNAYRARLFAPSHPSAQQAAAQQVCSHQEVVAHSERCVDCGVSVAPAAAALPMCDEFVVVPRSAIEHIGKHFPTLMHSAGLHGNVRKLSQDMLDEIDFGPDVSEE